LSIYIGIAAWAVPKEYTHLFPGVGSHLERYAQVFPAVEINTSFYKPHRPATYARWALSVPQDFRFAVKIPREITHIRRLSNTSELLDKFFSEAGALGDKLGPLLIQLPPSLRFSSSTAGEFFTDIRRQFTGGVVCEPRHPSWFIPEAEQMLAQYQIARAAADPAVLPEASLPGGWGGLVYYRLHGSPQMYYSSYSEQDLDTLAGNLLQLSQGESQVWCILDNTAQGAAIANGLYLLERLQFPGRTTFAIDRI
jgi:uncharacterized protein YecE (DUF72 family)